MSEPTPGAGDLAWPRKTFAGLGFKRASTLVAHVDSRDLGGHNPQDSTPKRPATWRYG